MASLRREEDRAYKFGSRLFQSALRCCRALERLFTANSRIAPRSCPVSRPILLSAAPQTCAGWFPVESRRPLESAGRAAAARRRFLRLLSEIQGVRSYGRA